MCNSIVPGKYLRGKQHIILITGKKIKLNEKRSLCEYWGRGWGGRGAHMHKQGTCTCKVHGRIYIN